MMRAWLIESIGVEGAAVLSKAYGGTRLNIPTAAQGVLFDRISLVIGEKLTVRLVSIAAGDSLYIPVSKPRLIAELVRAEIEARLSAGQSVAHIAQTYTTPPRRLSERHISTIKADMVAKAKCAASSQNYAPKPNNGGGCVAKFTQSTHFSTHGAHFGQNITDGLAQRSGDDDGLE